MASLSGYRGQSLVEESREEHDAAYGENESALVIELRVREVVEEELGQREPEEREAGEPQHAQVAGQSGVERDQRDHAPEGRDRRVAALEVGLEAGLADPLEEPEDRQ